MQKIRILMVDDHSLFRESLGRLLESTPGFVIVGQFAKTDEAVQAILQTEPDVVLLDYDLGEESGLRLLSELESRNSPQRVLMVTAGISDEVTVRLMEAGAAGVFLKHGSPDELMRAIEQVARGDTWLDTAALRALLEGNRNRSAHIERTRPLTDRQRQVLLGILDGLANKEIAWNLKTSETSVKAAIQELFGKAGVRTRSQLVRIAIEKHSSDWLGS